MNLSFSRPEAFWLLLAAVPIIALHLRPTWRKVVPTATLFVWREVLAHRSLRLMWPAWSRWVSLALELLILTFVVTALADPRWALRTHEKFVVFAVDRSLSIDPPSTALAQTFVDETRRRAPPDRAAVFSFGEPQSTVVQAASPQASPPPAGTNLEQALRDDWERFPAGYVPQLVLLSDGNQTQGDALAAARQSPVPIDVVPLAGREAPEVSLRAMRFPGELRQGDPVDLELQLWSCLPAEGTVRIIMQPGGSSDHRVTLVPGENTVRLQHLCSATGEIRVDVSLGDFADRLAENNHLHGRLYLFPRPRALLLRSHETPGKGDDASNGADRLAQALRDAGIDLSDESPEAIGDRLASPELDLLILSNLPATALRPQDVAKIEAYVRHGGGLLVLGGPNAFTSGGYAGTDLEKLLPLLAISADKDRSVLALLLLIDCSESMEGQRIAMAKEAARRALEMLQPRDLVGILAYEDRPHWIVPLGPCSDKQNVALRIDSLEAKGRTNLAPALTRAIFALRAAFADRKHVVLLTDGLSQMDDFAAITRQMVAEEISLSSVALGDEAAGPMLRELAHLGHGRCYECRDPASVPKVFAVEALVAGRRGIHEGTLLVGSLPDLAPKELAVPGLPALLACNECRLADQAQAWLRTANGEPLLAVHCLGQGQVAAFTADIDGVWTAAWLQWSGFERFWTAVARQIMRPRSMPALPTEYSAEYPPEFRVGPADTALLRQIAETSGGRYDPQPGDVFAPSDRTAERLLFLWPYLWGAALVLLLVEITARSASRLA